jgi:hypothetical protein
LGTSKSCNQLADCFTKGLGPKEKEWFVTR